MSTARISKIWPLSRSRVSDSARSLEENGQLKLLVCQIDVGLCSKIWDRRPQVDPDTRWRRFRTRFSCSVANRTLHSAQMILLSCMFLTPVCQRAALEARMIRARADFSVPSFLQVKSSIRSTPAGNYSNRPLAKSRHPRLAKATAQASTTNIRPRLSSLALLIRKNAQPRPTSVSRTATPASALLDIVKLAVSSMRHPLSTTLERSTRQNRRSALLRLPSAMSRLLDRLAPMTIWQIDARWIRQQSRPATRIAPCPRRDHCKVGLGTCPR